MDLIRASAFLHIVFSILLTGLALYWVIMSSALAKGRDAAEAARLLAVAHHARWPHVVVPQALRIPLPWMTWLVIAALAATGIGSIALRGAPGNGLWWIKLALVAAVIVIQVPLTLRPYPALCRIHFALVLATVLVSGWTLR
jgi:hypothetical protein